MVIYRTKLSSANFALNCASDFDAKALAALFPGMSEGTASNIMRSRNRCRVMGDIVEVPGSMVVDGPDVSADTSHPECRPGERFVGNISIADFGANDLPGKRLGEIAYDVSGKPISTDIEPSLRPLFATA